jgi:hypothetical protein
MIKWSILESILKESWRLDFHGADENTQGFSSDTD